MKLNKKIAVMAGIMTLAISIASPIVASDGCHFSDFYYHLYEPYQKAVIYWDGTVETLILASAGQSENLTDMAWVVPIISTTMPNVTEGNMSVFEELVKYFDDYYTRMVDDNGWILFGEASGHNVTVLEIKEVDIYDIIILQATDVSDLVNWLENNGFKVSKEAFGVLAEYVDTDNCYFVVNKIDLKNKHQEVMDLIENGTITVGFSPSSPSLGWAINQWSFDFFLKVHAFQILCNKEFPELRPWIKDYRPNYLLELGFTQGEYDELVNLYSSNDQEFIDSVTQYSIYDDNIDEIITDNETREKYDAIIEALFKRIGPIYDFYQILLDLRKGVATPLKFEFTPLEPYYPLTISSLNAGYGMIDVYVVSEHPVIDKNNVLDLDECKVVDEELREKLSQHFSVDKANFVSRLSFHGELIDLTDDAVFTFFPLTIPEQPITVEKKEDFYVLVSEQHLWGITWDINGEVIEVQYKLDEDDTWRVADGTKFWSVDLSSLSLENGKHNVQVRLLKQDGLEFSYSNTSQLTFNMLNGNAVTPEALEEYNKMISDIIVLTSMTAITIIAMVIVVRKALSTQ